jgi:beta-glucosidase-like glycosyl hydrolase
MVSEFWMVAVILTRAELGNHVIIGWLGRRDTEILASKGAIAGVFLSSRNFPPGSSVADIRRTVDELQAVRQKAGLPRLWIATDQEGGPVEKLSPPLSPQPALMAMLGSDWLPFREISKSTDSGIMLSHVRMVSLDPDQPISCSSAAIRFLRKGWGFRGLLVTDDFSMAPISHGSGGIARAARQSMAAGVDLILLSYDPGVVYDLLGEELAKGTL